MLTPNSSVNIHQHRYSGCFHDASTREKIFWVWGIVTDVVIKNIMHLKMSSAKCRPFCSGLDVLLVSCWLSWLPCYQLVCGDQNWLHEPFNRHYLHHNIAIFTITSLSFYRFGVVIEVNPLTQHYGLNSLAHGRMKFWISNFQANFCDLVIFCEITLRWMSLYLTGDKPTLVLVIASCIRSGNKPLLEPLLNQIYVAICCHYTTVS